jgi:hypothetical protein
MVWLPYERAKQLANEATFVQSDPVWQEGSGMWQGRLHDTLDHSDPDRFARASALLDRGFDINARAEYKGAGGQCRNQDGLGNENSVLLFIMRLYEVI